MGKLLTTEQTSSFRERGIVYPLRVLDAVAALEYRRECDLLEAQLGGRPRTIEVRQMHLHFPWAYRLATEPRVLDAVEDLLGPDLIVWATELFAKHPSDQIVSIGWHRDEPYMGLSPEQTVTAWIALSPSNVDNGCMRVAREVDRRGTAGRRPENGNGCVTLRATNAEALVPEAPHSPKREVQPPEEQIEDVVLEAGEMSLHDVHVLHGSGPNRGREKRVGFAIRFSVPQAKPVNERPPAILARGEDRHGFFDLREQPMDAEPGQALSKMQHSAREHLDATLRNLQRAGR